MLCALELNGFKSFADNTRLEFPAGITVVVGPNGSGKSNVVDAIKWVLGSQSYKSLRAKETTDVIFSGSRTRRPANAAEASLFFDNSAGLLDHDATQVQITRRVYRSGEAEYLLNRQPCRLRDIRDLLAGVGMATGAYSIIEQGKVDAVLQASPQERRLIFEEAAGVSRFRVKREEAARRMERVEQNLLRLGDIVQDLQTRLRTVRSQAGRAQRFTELTTRLAQLRSRTGKEDWRRLTGQIAAVRTQVESDEAAAARLEADLARHDADVAALDAQAEALRLELGRLSAAEADVRERRAQCASTRNSHLARIDELRQEGERLVRQIEALLSRAGNSQQMLRDAQAEREDSQQRLAAQQSQLDEKLRDMQAAETSCARLRQQLAAARQRLDSAEGEAAALESDQRLASAEWQALDAALAKSDHEAVQLAELNARLGAESQEAAAALVRRTEELAAATRDLEAAQTALADDRARSMQFSRRLADCEGRLAGARERIAVLEELERQLDGLTVGAKEVLRRAREQPRSAFGCVQGVVADLLRVDADSAPLVEIVLGERANFLVVTDANALALLFAADSQTLPGRTSFLRLDVPTPASAVDRVDLSREPGVMGRADRFVDAPPELAGMVRRLLARHWLVDSLATALQLSSGVGRGLNFITAAGETVLADGTLTVGPRQTTTGLLSRKSELRALGEQMIELVREATLAKADREKLEGQIAAGEVAVRRFAQQQAAALHAHADARSAAASLADRLAYGERRLAEAVQQQQAAVERRRQLEAVASQALSRLAVLQREEAELRASIEAAGAQLAELESQRSQLHHAVTDQRVEVARIEQRVEGLCRQEQQLQRDHAERDQTLEDTRALAAQCQQQSATLTQAVSDLDAAAAESARQRDELASATATRRQTHEQSRQARAVAAAAADRVRAELLDRHRRQQVTLLELQKLEQDRSVLVERLREEFKIDVAQLATAGDAPLSAIESAAERQAIEAEVRALRQQLADAGPVNLEAVAELQALESRHASMARQQEDLQSARTRLEQIISQINGESRELFTATVNEVRGHFQEIFGRLFAGGEADIIVETEPGGDVLESGVSIMARPPGKQPRNISLLSGGERTLTCVALLLAIFRSRPSPFCVLDEVDAALDEANIDRFVDVLKQFMRATQFIVITHSKRTMACGDTLYGVTMQESGVSKRVSVRFEDVGEDGRIRESALRADAGGAAQSRAA